MFDSFTQWRQERDLYELDRLFKKYGPTEYIIKFMSEKEYLITKDGHILDISDGIDETFKRMLNHNL